MRPPPRTPKHVRVLVYEQVGEQTEAMGQADGAKGQGLGPGTAGVQFIFPGSPKRFVSPLWGVQGGFIEVEMGQSFGHGRKRHRVSSAVCQLANGRVDCR
jgi:hypothetical protein